MNRKLLYILCIALVLMLAVSPALGARQVKEVVKKQVVESQYGRLGEWLGIGDRIYIVTYKDGTSQEIFERTTFALFRWLGKATIVEGGYETRWAQAGTPVAVNFRAVGVNLPSTCAGYPSCTVSVHKFELVDITGDYQFDVLATTDEISLKVNPLSYEGRITMTIPAHAAGKRTFNIIEYVKKVDGSGWLRGGETYISYTAFDVIWTQDVQAGQPTPAGTPVPTVTVVPTNPAYTPPQPMVELAVESEPSGATVQVSGGVVGNTPVLISISPQEGEKTLVVSKSGYKTVYAKVSASTQSPYTVKLEPTGTQTATATSTATRTPTQTQGYGAGGTGGTPTATVTKTEAGDGVGEGEPQGISETTITLVFVIAAILLVAYFGVVRRPKGKKGKK